MTLNNNTILRRQGNKGNLLQPLFRAFPDMVTLIEPFAGTLAVSLHALRTGRAEKCIVNDIDNEVFNLWQVLRDSRDALVDALEITPSHAGIFHAWKTIIPDDPVWRAARLLFQSNFSFLGSGDTFRVSGRGHDREILLN